MTRDFSATMEVKTRNVFICRMFGIDIGRISDLFSHNAKKYIIFL